MTDAPIIEAHTADLHRRNLRASTIYQRRYSWVDDGEVGEAVVALPVVGRRVNTRPR